MARATILIVDDDPGVCRPLAEAFRLAGFAVLQAADAVQGLQIASEHRPDLIFMDIQLPDLDGISVVETLKSDPTVRHIPVVAMTGYDIMGEQARSMGRNCAAYVQKPLRPRDLINLATALLKLPAEPPDHTPRRTEPHSDPPVSH